MSATFTLTLTREQALAIIDAAAFYDLERSDYLREYPDEFTLDEADAIHSKIGILRAIEGDLIRQVGRWNAR